MSTYYCHLIDEDGRLSSVEAIDAASDHVAALAADRLVIAQGRATAELWLGDVRVYRTKRSRTWATAPDCAGAP
jgi:hypothetical protein